jgi:hypothetical protein
MTWSLGGDEWSASCTGRFTIGERAPHPVPIGRRLGEPQSRSGRGGEENISLLCPSRESNPGRPARSLDTILIQLPRLATVMIVMTLIILIIMSRDSSVGVATGYRLDDRGSIPGGAWKFFSSPRP